MRRKSSSSTSAKCCGSPTAVLNMSVTTCFGSKPVSSAKKQKTIRFLNRIVFCFFAEDTGLLPKHVVTDIFKTAVGDPQHFAEVLEELFRRMAKGGTFGPHKIRHFNGHLFEEASVFELTEEEIGKLATAGEADWQFIQPSIMGNLFERGLDPNQRAQLGARITQSRKTLRRWSNQC